MTTPPEFADRLATLEDTVADLVDLLDARGRQAGPWWWEQLTPEQSAQLWVDLGEFVAYLSRRYLVHAPGEYRLPPCWWRHPIAVEHLTALMVAHIGAYRDPDATPGPALIDFHERSLWPTLERLRSLRVFSACQDGGHVERRGSAVPWEPDAEYAAHVPAGGVPSDGGGASS